MGVAEFVAIALITIHRIISASQRDICIAMCVLGVELSKSSKIKGQRSGDSYD